MKILIGIIFVLLTGCTSVPVAPKFPELPPSLKNQCPDLMMAQDSEKLSDLLSTVAKNYGSYYECQILVESWQAWYAEQSKIYNNFNSGNP